MNPLSAHLWLWVLNLPEEERCALSSVVCVVEPKRVPQPVYPVTSSIYFTKSHNYPSLHSTAVVETMPRQKESKTHPAVWRTHVAINIVALYVASSCLIG